MPIYITYHDSKADEKHGYKIEEPKPGSLILKPGLFPGQYGYPDLHIAHLTMTAFTKTGEAAQQEQILLIVITDHLPSKEDYRRIAYGAVEFAVKAGLIQGYDQKGTVQQ